MKKLQISIGATPWDTHVTVDDQPIGMIQEIKFHVGVDASPMLELIFPDLRAVSAGLAKKVADQVELLKDLPQVKITLAPVDLSKM